MIHYFLDEKFADNFKNFEKLTFSIRRMYLNLMVIIIIIINFKYSEILNRKNNLEQ